MILFELLEWLGVGGSITTAAAIGLVALYARKGANILGFVAAVFGSAVSYLIVSLVALALAIGAGWLDPNPGAFISFGTGVLEAGFEVAVDLAGGVLG